VTDGVSLGTATLGLEANLAQLRGDLDDAKAKVAAAVAEMQAMLDKLDVGLRGGLLPAGVDASHGGFGMWAAAQDAALAGVRRSVGETDAAYAGMASAAQVAADVQVAASGRVVEAYAAQAAAARATADAEEAAAARSSAARSILGGIGGHGVARDVAVGASGIWGVRGPTPPPGGMTNPVVTVQEAASRTPLGSLAAAVGENAQGGGPESVTVATERSNTRTVVGSTPNAEQARQRAAAPVLLGLDAQRQQMMEGSLARAIAGLDAAQRPSAAGRATTVAGLTQEDQKVAEATGSAVADALAAQAAARAAQLSGGAHAPGQFASAALADVLAAKGMRAALGPDLRMRVYGEGGEPGTHNFGVIPGAVVGGPGGRGGSGGSGGGGVPPWLTALLWGRGGGGGGGRLGGLLGVGAGIGTVGSFAGFGAEHIALTLGGIAGSGVAALGGGALLGLGAAGKLGVGAGSDLAVLKSTIADTKTLQTRYDAVAKAVAVYGKNSEQAKVAQKELNFTMAELGNTAGVKAELGLAKAAEQTNKFWDLQTSNARVQATKLLSQFLQIAHAYIPLVAQAAEQNLAIIDKDLKPLTRWLVGPEGMGIFLQLENEFRNQIPTAMHAFDQGFQLIAKTIAYTAPLTGGFLKTLDTFFTKWNSPGQFAVWEGEINRLVGDFRVWEAFVKILAKDLFDLFHNDAHTGEGIIQDLTRMLVKVNEWEKSTRGSAAIRSIFTVHKEEVLALLGLLPPLISGFSHIYTTIAPPLVTAVTDIAKAFAALLGTIEKAGPLGTWAIGLALILAKLKLLVPLLRAAGVEIGLLSAAEGENAAAAGLDAGAQGTLAASETSTLAGAGGATLGAAEGGAGGLLAGGAKSLLLKAGIGGVAGLLGGSLLAGAVGAHGTLGTAISAAGAGAGLGFTLGPAAGALLGTELAPGIGTAIGAGLGFAAPYAVKFLSDVFSTHAPEYGKKFGDGFARTFSSALGPTVAKESGAAITHALAAVAKTRHELAVLEAGARLLAKHEGGFEVTPHEHAAAFNKAFTAELRAGLTVAEQLKHVQENIAAQQHGSAGAFARQDIKTLLQVPAGELRFAGAQAMIDFTKGLETAGELPKGAVHKVIGKLEAEFPALGTYLAAHGYEVDQKLSQSLRLQQSEAQLKHTLHNMEASFGVILANPNATGETLKKEWQSAMRQLEQAVKEHVPGATHALAELGKAGGLNAHLMAQAAREVGEATVSMAQQIAEGMSSVNTQVGKELKALGAGSEVIAGLQGKPAGISGTPFSAQRPGEGALAPGHAQGALYQIGAVGAAGRDTIGLNVGGMPIRVGEGEQVAVLNRHQQPIVNDALAAAGYGGLLGLFDSVSTPNYMAAGGIVAPHVSGHGALPDVARAALADVTRAANSKVAGTHPAGGAPGGASHASMPYLEHLWVQAGGPAGVAHLMAAIAMAESGGDPAAHNASGASGLWQILGLPFPGNPFNPLENARMAVSKYRSQGLGAWETYTSGAYRGFYAKGGLLGFAKGGLPGVGAKFPQRSTASGLPKGLHFNPFGRIPAVKTAWSGQAAWGSLNAMMGSSGPVARLVEQYGLEGTAAEIALQAAPHAGAFVISPNALEKAAGIVAPYEDVANVELRGSQLHGLQGTEQGILNELTNAWNLSEQVLADARAGISERNQAIAELKARIRANLKKIRELRAAIKHQEEALKKIPTGKHASASDKARAAKLHQEIADENAQVRSLEGENRSLGGEPGGVGQGGNIGVLNNEVTELTTAKASTEGWVTEIGGATGMGGKRQEAKNEVAKLTQQLVELGQTPERLKEALLEAGGGAESPLELAEREKGQLEEKLKISHEETRINANALGVFGGPGDIGLGGKNAFAAAAARGMLIPASWIPSMDVGGVVPGARGAPQLVLAHGQEEILTPEQREQRPSVVVHQKNEMMHPSDPVVLKALGDASVRGMRLQGCRPSKRLVPGA
jgi:Lysozyme like domain